MPMFFIFFVSFLTVAPTRASQDGRPENVLERCWQTARQEIYPKTLEERFTSEAFTSLHKKAQSSRSLEELDPALNDFLESLGISHTKFYQENDPDYHFMRSLFSTKNPDSHPIWHIGAQFLKQESGYRVREVLEGYPAQRADLRRSDLLLKCNSMPFHPLRCFQSGRQARLDIQRNSSRNRYRVTPLFESPARSFINAMKNSVRIFRRNGKRIGYFHFWIGAFDENIRAYDQIIGQRLYDTDALILDLRGGFGGASLLRVDPFFPDRNSYAKTCGILRDGTVTEPEAWEPKQNPHWYRKPMVVLTNDGVRSGKEMMAFQFKKTGRAMLLGSRTAGMFVGGKMWFADENRPYRLYLAYRGVLLDGVNIEGSGVKPDIEVPYPIDRTLVTDPQLDRALELVAYAP